MTIIVIIGENDRRTTYEPGVPDHALCFGLICQNRKWRMDLRPWAIRKNLGLMLIAMKLQKGFGLLQREPTLGSLPRRWRFL